MKEREQIIKQPNVLIAGYGIVGKQLKDLFTFSDVYDVAIPETLANKTNHYDFCFVCVPTPFDFSSGGECDYSIVESVIAEINADIFIVKSTIPPLTTNKLAEKLGKKIVFSPEYSGSTKLANQKQDFVIFGGSDELCQKCCELYYPLVDKDFKFYCVTAETAELTKYMENCYLGLKVTFCNEFYRVANKLGIEWEELRKCFIADSRVNPSHTFIFRDYPFYDSKCLNKDIPAIIKFSYNDLGINMDLMKSVVNTNKKFQQEKNYINEFFDIEI